MYRSKPKNSLPPCRDPVGGALSCYNSIRSTLSRHKNKGIANSPKTVKEVKAAFESPETMDRYGYSLDIPRRLMYHGTVCTEAYEFTVYSSAVVIDFIKEAEHALEYTIDGTFGVVPEGEFRQLLVVHLKFKAAGKDHVSFSSGFVCLCVCKGTVECTIYK